MLTDKGFKRRYSITEYNAKNATPPDGWKFPTTFDHIINESSSLIKTVGNVSTSIDPTPKVKISSADENLKNLKENKQATPVPALNDKKPIATSEEKKPARSSNQKRRRRPQNKNRNTSPSDAKAQNSVGDKKPQVEAKKHSTPADNNGQKKNNNQKRRFNKNKNRTQAPKKTE